MFNLDWIGQAKFSNFTYANDKREGQFLILVKLRIPVVLDG